MKTVEDSIDFNIRAPENDKLWKLTTIMAMEMSTVGRVPQIKLSQKDRKALDIRISNCLNLFKHIADHVDREAFNKNPKTDFLLDMKNEELGSR